MFRRQPALAVVTIAYLGVVAWVTLGPQPLNAAGRGILRRVLNFFGNHSATDWITYDRVEFTANVLMFVPIGLLFVLLFGRRQWWLAMLAGIALTLTIELAQMSLADRVSDPRDVLANSIGAFVGVLVALVVTAPAARRERRMSRARQFAATR
jgi:glycopeptide antibiotics resistance protein